MNSSIQTLSTKDPTWLAKAVDKLSQGGVVALPFERLYGLAADAQNETAVANVIAAKERREKDKPISVIVPNLEAVTVFAKWTPIGQKAAKKYWPGPLTMILPAKPNVPSALVSKSGLIGVRQCGQCPAGLVAQKSGMILTATSANVSGAKDVTSHCELSHLKGVDLIIEGTVEGPPGTTVVDVSGDKLRVIRQGAVHIDEDEED